MKTKVQALTHCLDILNAFAARLEIPCPDISSDELWGSYCIASVDYHGHQIEFTPFYRHQEQKTSFSWDVNTPNWEASWEDGVDIIFGVGEVDHPNCPTCECSLDVCRQVKSSEEAASFAAEVA